MALDPVPASPPSPAAGEPIDPKPALPRAHFLQPLLQTPFHEQALRASQLESFIPWSGYSTVDVFSSVEQEYFAIRNASSVYDLSPMVKYRIGGPDAGRYLERLMTRNISALAEGRVAYCIWCDDAGHLIDDGTLFRLGPSEYRLCSAERQLDWLLDSAVGFDVQIEEVTARIAALALQGPTSFAILEALGMAGVERLKPFEVRTFEMGALRVLVSRTGFTGDLGYELWVAPEEAAQLWEALMLAGQTRGLRSIGSRALNIARIEAGYLQSNVDFVSSARTVLLGRDRSPLELGLEWLVDFEKGHFTGRRALLEERRRGLARSLVGLDIEGTKPAHDALVYADRNARRQVGSVTSAAWSPTCKRNLALALLDAPHFCVGRFVWVEIYLRRDLVWERRMVRATVVERPFFAPARRRATPPGRF